MRTLSIISILVLCAFLSCRKEKKEETKTPTPAPSPTIDVERKVSFDWNRDKGRDHWSVALADEIETFWADLSTATDMNQLCTLYDTLDERNKKQAWGELMVAVSYFESAWDPSTRYFEKTMGYYSEGLFQLSVVDEEWAKCGLTQDNILFPIPNIKCAVAIMARQIRKKHEVLLNKGMYWAVIREGGKYQKIDAIKSRIENSIPHCKK